MNKIFLAQFETDISEIWSMDEADKIPKAMVYFKDLIRNIELKNYLLPQFVERNDPIELVRSAKYGFILTAYAEPEEKYRSPHNHGLGWVIYGVIEGRMEMKTYGFTTELIFKESLTMGPMAYKVYLPGQIHDTLCLADKSIILRFTSCDLKQEEQKGRMRRF